MAKRFPYTQKTMRLLEEQGYKVGIVERVIPRVFIRKDLFGIVDLIAIRPGEIVGVQSTSWNQRLDHLQTLRSSANTVPWLESGAKLLLVSWKKRRAGTRHRYEPVTEWIEHVTEGLIN
jgi:hypothetical protein